jgi:hypothetical protein
MTYSATGIPQLAWTSVNATSASISPGWPSGVSPVSGGTEPISLNFHGTETYTLTLVGPGGTATYSTTVTGNCPVGGCGGGNPCRTCFLPDDPDSGLPPVKFGRDEFSWLDLDVLKPRTPSDEPELVGEGG